MRDFLSIISNLRFFWLFINDGLFYNVESRLFPHRSTFDVHVSRQNLNCRSRRTLFLNLFKFYFKIQFIDKIIDLQIQAIHLNVFLVLITLQMFSVAFFRRNHRVTDEAPVWIGGNRSLYLLVLALLGLELLDMSIPFPFKFIFISHYGFIFLFRQENRLT